MGWAVCVFMSVCLRVHVQVYACAWVCGYMHLAPALYEDPTSLRADNCTYIQRTQIVHILYENSMEHI
jgi:hypothetical protein